MVPLLGVHLTNSTSWATRNVAVGTNGVKRDVEETMGAVALSRVSMLSWKFDRFPNLLTHFHWDAELRSCPLLPAEAGESEL